MATPAATLAKRRRWMVALPVLIALIPAASAPPRASALRDRDKEYKVKVAFLYQFPKYVTWPKKALPAGGKTITYGILGNEAFAKYIEGLAGKKVKGRKIRVVRFKSASQVTGCQVLWISGSLAKKYRTIRSHFAKKAILVVSHSSDFMDDGGIINFTIRKRHIRFEINLESARAAGLKLSAKLVKLAVRVHKPSSE